MNKWFRWVAYPTIGSLVFLLVACSSMRPQTADSECGPLIECPPGKVGCRPIRVCDNPTVLTLANDLDHLERHIDWYGSVVAKVPDVWGQARLTQYRDEFEKAMAQDRLSFDPGLQGALSRSDTAYFASATALSFAAQPKPPLIGTVSSTKGDAPKLVSTDGKTAAVTTSPASASDPTAKAADPVKPLDLDDPNSLVSGTETVIGARNPARLPGAHTFGNGKDGTIGIEPTEQLAQKKRYLDFLAQIRRENEGDDTADSPGYSLNLMRIPVSLLPGKRTDVGFGAEITMTVSPVLGDDLLPMTFRNLLQNDIVNQLSFPLTQVLDGGDFEKVLTEDTKQLIEGINLLRRWAAIGATDRKWIAWEQVVLQYDRLPDIDKLRIWVTLNTLLEPDGDFPKPGKQMGGDAQIRTALKYVLDAQADLDALRHQKMGCLSPLPAGTLVPAKKMPDANLKFRSATQGLPTAPLSNGSAYQAALQRIKAPNLSFSNGLDNRIAVPTSQLFDVYGDANLFAIGFGATEALGAAFKKQKYAHLPDVQTYLREEARAAYQFLAQPGQHCLWDEFCTQELVTAIRSRQVSRLQDMRDEFRCRVEALTLTDQFRLSRPDNELMQFSKTAALAWCIIVDSALLSDRLIRDMKETATSKGKALPGCAHWCPYFLPEPPAECRQAFNEYAKLRWPVHVFALDPYIQEQNIADSLSTRREMQLALSIAFTNGQISARNMTKYVRRLEAEYETIALNRTQVGFSHGENVFGWRFYPRFQSPDTKSNLEVLFREQLIGGPNRNMLLRDRRLEPGERECVAVVMMPSFVPYVTVDTASNWFPLPNPKHKVLDTAQAVKLSRAVQTIKTCATGVQDTTCYRDGEFTRLQRRAEQLEARLPLQTLTSAVPILNTTGGFEMFSNGTSDLAPELFGWYGAPGIDPTATSTTLFLVGDHFSPLRTRVIVGNQAVDNETEGVQTLLSRQVMQVTFKNGAYPLNHDKGGATVRVHVATPYGVTRELDIPVVKQTPEEPKQDTPPGFSFGDSKFTVQYAPTTRPGVDPKFFTPVGCGSGNAEGLKINWVAPGGALTQKVKIAFAVEFPSPAGEPLAITLPCKCEVIGEVKGKTITISKAALDCLANELIGQIAQGGPSFARDTNPLAKGIKTKKVTVTPIVPDDAVAQGAETTDQLSIEFKPVACCAAPIRIPFFPNITISNCPCVDTAGPSPEVIPGRILPTPMKQ